MPQRTDTDTFGFLIADLSRLLRAEIDRRTAEAGLGLTSGEARALSHAARAGTVRQSVLAERMNVEAMTLSAYLDRLEARDLIRRTPDPADRRAKLVHLTEAAERVLPEIRNISAAIREDASRGLTAEQWAMLQDMLKTVRANFSEKAESSRAGAAA
ncbi:MarR family transcriptional regulator [Aquamicrobium sp. LC103]|uniref:MarR family winged helix-turn-helix transcriptional regulator n=1 Tax=Aquamicrobium sp. LC103 TaxID=1120658 RepID=UPI00063ECB2B|nr:MarR family transcriptional regulator [Aquamicrobium sp. LC103]TKT82950.1 MarR family transcriptional regulator [Aquamicrobium sp. LC103]